MGFPASPPPYLDPNRNATFGVSFASSGASFNVTGYTFPAFQASQQLEWFDKIQADAAESAGGADASLPSPSVFSTALYVVGLGPNDYFVLFFGEKIDETTLPRITAGGAKQVQAFASAVVAALKAYVQALYSRGARRFLLFEIPPLGCLPLWRQALQPAEKQGECVSAISAYSQEHNRQLAVAIAALRKTLKGSDILLAKTYGFTEKAVADPPYVGLLGTNACCGGPPPLNGLVQCGTSDTIGGYKVTATACSRPQDSIFWDRLHPTEAFNRELAKSIFLGGKDSIEPMNLRQLASSAAGVKKDLDNDADSIGDSGNNVDDKSSEVDDDGKSTDRKTESRMRTRSHFKLPEPASSSKHPYAKALSLIRAGEWSKLTGELCKAYLRYHRLRLSDLTADLINRIQRHYELKDVQSAKRQYPRTSFHINCTGDDCKNDVVLFNQRISARSVTRHERKATHGGYRSVAGRVVSESYGVKKQQHTFTVEVIWRSGLHALAPMTQLLVKGRVLYRHKTFRQVDPKEKAGQESLGILYSREHFAAQCLDRKHELW
ncbi:unnamed protein product [Closterium sp. Yama58-4]|nr:unnamed protein product [Closterium sp. Yama58-4]